MSEFDIDKVSKELGIDPFLDRGATDLLDALVKKFEKTQLQTIIEGKRVLVFGCGPSLAKDIEKIKYSTLKGGVCLTDSAGVDRHSSATSKSQYSAESVIKSSKTFSNYAIVAADGATRALLKTGIKPHIIVTDLDGDVNSIISASSMGSIVILHAHADNINAIRINFKHIPGKVYGTTQRKATSKVLNLGGFTDGDRAVYLTEHFKPKMIVLAGMDFGKEIGEYSGRCYNLDKKLKKLEIGRKLIENLAAETSTPIFNLTEGGVDLNHIPRATVEYLKTL